MQGLTYLINFFPKLFFGFTQFEGKTKNKELLNETKNFNHVISHGSIITLHKMEELQAKLPGCEIQEEILEKGGATKVTEVLDLKWHMETMKMR